MGGGGLRILGHKKWHVWTRENIEKVRRDERLHDEKTKKETREKRKRDLDSRVEILKQGKGVASETATASTAAPLAPPSSEIKHINFFQEAEDYHNKKLLTPAAPKVHPDEGIALGGDLNPAYRPHHPNKRQKKNDGRHHPSLPWYAHGKHDIAEDGEAVKRESYADPMGDILGHQAPFLELKSDTSKKRIDFAGDKVVSTRDKDGEAESRRRRDNDRRDGGSDSSSESDDRQKKHKKHHKKHHKSKKSKRKGDDLMETLRAERRAREEAERSRAKKLC
ncbi:Aste57867_19405 [Aphanomyces stellatus]|uniref:Aste57867_19405 protein n=1 Tax=Aphanomyces stellatus TaxID=120398 RepID=A0A485LDV5_9STRA|nr:hypothetical protein As57867_019341 [Aphanomyces stellatus]VFT96119.1 Aste57867_19405 [Aphanomyces stellatus]